MRAIRLTTAILALFISFLVEGATIPITILHTSNLHAHLRPDDEGRGGFAELTALIASEKQRATNVLVLDAGDLVQGTPVSTVFHGTPIYEVANFLGLDAGILGNQTSITAGNRFSSSETPPNSRCFVPMSSTAIRA